MRAAWLVMAAVGAIELYCLRRGDRRTRLAVMTLWVLCLGYAGATTYGDWLPLPVWLVRALFGWTD